MTAPTQREIKVIVGLGNPGPEYGSTYHNAGFLALDRLADRLGAGPFKHHRLAARARAGHVLLVKPTTFMNDSGRAIREALEVAKATPEELLVLHDDSDLELGTARFALGRGSAGHRGVGSVIEQLGTKNFWRLRLGIRAHPGKAGAFVLRAMAANDTEKLYGAFDGAMEKFMEKVTPPGA